MKPTMALHRAYFFVVVWLTLWVGYFGFFRPQEILRALPWPVPPLHARFIGAFYLSATVFLVLSMLARSLLQVRTIVIMAFTWTGWLLLITILHWGTFDFARPQVWFWVIAYVLFPIAAAWLAWGGPAQPPPAHGRIRQPWIPVFLRVQGILLVALAAACFVVPARVATIWPWKISTFLAQVYSGPVLAYGVGSLVLAARRNWIETLIPSAGFLLFSVLAMAGSFLHLSVFTSGSPSEIVWFVSLGLIVSGSLVLLLGAIPKSSPAASAGPTPIGWPLRFWFVVELFFALSATMSVALHPAETATRFAWTIQPPVMAALFGAFYVAVAPVVVLALFARHWESVRVFVIPGMVFTFAQLVVTFLHWDRFAHGSLPFQIWFASYLLPPPVFLGCYIWQQRRAAPITPETPLRSWQRIALIVLGSVFTLEALTGLFHPAWISKSAPWKITPLNARALGGYLLLLGAMMLSMARENDRDRVRFVSPFLILLLPVAALQVSRFSDQVDWSHPQVAVFAALLAVVSALGISLFRGSWRRALGR